METISETRPRARKNHICNACEWINRDLSNCQMTFSEAKEYVKAMRNGFKIKKGELYVKQFNKDGGDTWTYKAIPAMHAIAIKYDVFDD